MLAQALYVFLIVVAYGAVLLIFVRPLITKYLDKISTIDSVTVQKSLLVGTYVAIFLSAFFTEIVGVHTIFGAFLLGLAFPSNNPTALRE